MNTRVLFDSNTDWLSDTALSDKPPPITASVPATSSCGTMNDAFHTSANAVFLFAETSQLNSALCPPPTPSVPNEDVCDYFSLQMPPQSISQDLGALAREINAALF